MLSTAEHYPLSVPPAPGALSNGSPYPCSSPEPHLLGLGCMHLAAQPPEYFTLLPTSA
ncbi:MAG: hypothetical protein IJV22_08100 [Bacteroidales bacterium]|nr:hypothetical protein [Bacteroidales bacterium]